MSIGNYERISSYIPQEQVTSNLIYIDDHRKRRIRRAEKYQEINKGLIILAIIAFTFITCALFNL